MKIQALSIVNPAVNLILDGIKTHEIRSWLPSEIPLMNILLVQNNRYLEFDKDEDEGVGLAIVDFTRFSTWTEVEHSKAGSIVTLGRDWKKGYYKWEINNIRILKNPIFCKAKKGIYEIEVDSIALKD